MAAQSSSTLKGIDALVISDEEQTFQYQDDLASLPVPDLKQTLHKYLDSVRPHVTDEELREVEYLCEEFEAGEGKVLNEKLKEIAKTKRNWLERWWENVAYMETRLPSPLMNMAGPGPYLYDIWKPKEGTMIPRCALMLYYVVEFWQLIRKQRIKPHKDGKGRPMCMNQFRKLFSTCRIPGVKQDHLVHHFLTESQGDSPSHVIVMSKGHIFSLQVVDGHGKTLTSPELQSQLQRIHDAASGSPPAPGVSFFTALERPEWAKIRSHLVALHPQNYRTLQAIEDALVVIGLDDYHPIDVDDLSWNALLGDPNNKWFDKAMNFVGYGNGLFISNCDHSPMDGMMLVVSTYYVHCKLLECEGQWNGPTGVRKLPEPENLIFHLDNPLNLALKEAKIFYSQLRARVEVKVMEFTAYGKSYLKTRRIHPDTCVQLALQLAYHRIYNRPAPTYETATTRQFYHARTETVRSCTPESCRWCQSMTDKSMKDSERLQLFLAAVAKHNKLMDEATNLQGCDRHLFGLAMVARESGHPIPQLFQHPAFWKSGGGGYYVLSTSCIGYTTVFGAVAPMCPNGYGVFYCIQEDRVMLCITSWTEDEGTSSKRLAIETNTALIDIRRLLDSTKGTTARL